MAYHNQKQYIHYDSPGFIYHFSLLEKNLWVRMLKENIEFHSMKLEEKVLEFSIGIDSAGKFHVASILETGHLKYGIYFNETWESKSLMTFNRNHSRLKNITLFVFEEKIHILMAQSYAENNEFWTIKHYYWNKQNWENQKVCEICTGQYDIPFYADIDEKNNIHLVYKSRIGRYHQIYYEKFLLPYRSWGIPIKISEGPCDHTTPFILCDREDTLHIAWSTFANGHYQINYFGTKLPLSYKSNLRKEINVFAKNGTDYTQPHLMHFDRNMIILWKEGSHFIIQKKLENAKQWSDPKRLANAAEKELIKVGIIGPAYKDMTPVKIIDAYGYIDDKITILGIDPLESPILFNALPTLKADDHESTLSAESMPQIFIGDHELVESQEDFHEGDALLEKLEEITLQNQILQKDLQFFMEQHQAFQTKIYVQIDEVQKKIEDVASSKKGFFDKVQAFFQKDNPS
ncbi:hypothetical protein [Geosporobacter ferrireducens]|uniref:Uncharacterized protein n=1 Tax=Geosporobacter ferrireducens TaxID=1424294 RepID=A0A1D8GPM0_9FIRM|nr:hypothetical protein [Geosporobacter ferrireducens]AOT72847.1 hypothetical protein Gferi_26785 [Geosporobacter ferrireducens]